MYSACKLNNQGDNIQPSGTSFPIWNQSIVPCPVLTAASYPAKRLLMRQVKWSGIPISLRIFQFGVIHTVKWSKWRCFSGILCFLYDPRNVGNLIPGSSAFSKSNSDIWKISVHVLLKPSMQNIEHNLTSMGDECNCPVV